MNPLDSLLSQAVDRVIERHTTAPFLRAVRDALDLVAAGCVESDWALARLYAAGTAAGLDAASVDRHIRLVGEVRH